MAMFSTRSDHSTKHILAPPSVTEHSGEPWSYHHTDISTIQSRYDLDPSLQATPTAQSLRSASHSKTSDVVNARAALRGQ